MRAAGTSRARIAPLTLVEVYDITFSGYDGDPVRGWFVVPAGAGAIADRDRYNGYGGGRACRTSGSERRYPLRVGVHGHARTGQRLATPRSAWHRAAGLGIPDAGIHDPAEYYYRRGVLPMDAVLFVDAIRALAQVDAARVAVTGSARVVASRPPPPA